MLVKANTVHELIFKRPVKGDVGIEFEVEYQEPPEDISSKVWRTKGDGSLRYHGFEYVTNGPVTIDKAPACITEINKHINAQKKVVYNSPRTSVHVHTNVSNHSVLEALNATLVGWLLENAMIKYCGEELREGNLFCLRLKDSENTINLVSNVLTNYGNRSPLDFSRLPIRYSAQNLRALAQFGSLEYRGMAGIYEDKKISDWVGAIHSITERSKEFAHPEAVMDFYFQVGTQAFVEFMLGKNYQHVVLGHPDWRTLIQDNEGMMLNFAYQVNWEQWAGGVSKWYTKQKMPVTEDPEAARINDTLASFRRAAERVTVAPTPTRGRSTSTWLTEPPRPVGSPGYTLNVEEEEF